MFRAGVTRHMSHLLHPIDWKKKDTVLHLLCRITVFFFYIDCKSWWLKPFEGNLILKAKCVVNKVINNKTEIRLKKKGWRWKNKQEKGNWNPRGYIVNKDQFHLLFKQYYLFQISVSPSKTSLTLKWLKLFKHRSYVLRLMRRVPQRSENVET